MKSGMLKRKARKFYLRKSKLNKLSSKRRKLGLKRSKLKLSRRNKRKPIFNPLPLQTNALRVLIS